MLLRREPFTDVKWPWRKIVEAAPPPLPITQPCCLYDGRVAQCGMKKSDCLPKCKSIQSRFNMFTCIFPERRPPCPWAAGRAAGRWWRTPACHWAKAPHTPPCERGSLRTGCCWAHCGGKRVKRDTYTHYFSILVFWYSVCSYIHYLTELGSRPPLPCKG